MPKAKRNNNKKGAAQRNTASTTQRRTTDAPASTTTDRQTVHTTRAARRIEQTSRAGSYQALIMPGMVTLGCLGLAISFSFFTTDPNRYLYGGIAALMALMWAYSFWLRMRALNKTQSSQKQQ
jgi:hypothetical protein